jgi:hypothetical protein
VLKSFRRFVLEGGNVRLGDAEAQRIDLTKLSRKEIVPVIDKGLSEINKAFSKSTGLYLWNDSLFKSKEFLSGSAFHFFDLKKIEDEKFSKVKQSVGDIDTQVDGNLEPFVEKFLNSGIEGETFGPLTFVGYKKSAGQFITLWTLVPYDINIQIDMELVEFDKTGKPTPWAQFSHSSAWEDMEQGIKGVAHKYLLRAMEAPNLKKVLIPAKTSRGKDKEILSSERAFSVTGGLRTKLSPIKDDSGKQIKTNDIPHYKEMSTAESPGNTDLDFIFKEWFGHSPSSDELKQFSSFTGLIDLIQKNLPKSSWKPIVTGFAYTLWGDSAQGLYRGDPDKDLNEKNVMIGVITKKLGGSVKDFDEMKKSFYARYK